MSRPEQADRPGRPPLDLDSHRRAAQDEDAAFLVAHGVDPEDVARRTGLTSEAGQKRAQRNAETLR